MTTYYVDSNATGSGDGSSWANAFATIEAAAETPVLVPSADKILVASDHDGTYANTTTITWPGTPGIDVISVNKVTGAYEPGASERCTNIGGAAFNMTGCVNYKGVNYYPYPASSSANQVILGSTATPHCIIWSDGEILFQSGTNASMGIILGPIGGTNNDDCYVGFFNMKFQNSAVNQNGMRLREGRFEIINCEWIGTVSPGNLFAGNASTMGQALVQGCDFGNMADTDTILVVAATYGPLEIRFVQCIMPPNIVEVISGAQNSYGGPQLWAFDCNLGGVANAFGYANVAGSVFSNKDTYVTGGVAGQSWQIKTTALCSAAMPFRTPFIDNYNSKTQLMLPTIECLRNDGVNAPYTNAQVWAEWNVQLGSNPLASPFMDRVVPEAAPANQPVGIGGGSWTNAAPAAPYSFKCDTGQNVTPGSAGVLRGRIGVSVPNIGAGQLFINPQQTGL